MQISCVHIQFFNFVVSLGITDGYETWRDLELELLLYRIPESFISV